MYSLRKLNHLKQFKISRLGHFSCSGHYVLYLEKDVHEVVELWAAEDHEAEDVAEDANSGHQRTQDTVEHCPHLRVHEHCPHL